MGICTNFWFILVKIYTTPFIFPLPFLFLFLFPFSFFFFSLFVPPPLHSLSLTLSLSLSLSLSLCFSLLYFSKISKTSNTHNFFIRCPIDACLVPLESSRREEQFERWFVAGNCRDSPENWPESSVFVGFAGIPISELFLEKRAPPSCSGGSKL